MTTGTNLQLTYNENTDSWSYENVNYEYTPSSANSWSGFTSPDPDFEYVPTQPDTSQPDGDDDPCPAGYIYDDVLKQCVPDPDYRAPSYYGEPQGSGGDDNNQGAEFIDFDASTPEGRKDMFEHGQDKGYFDTTSTAKGGAYEFLGPPQAPNLGFMTPLAQYGQNRQYNRYINELNKLNNERIAAGQTPILAQAIGFFGLAKSFKDWGNATMAIHSPNLTTGYQVPKIQGAGQSEEIDKLNEGTDYLERRLRQEKLRKAQADANKAEAQADKVINDTSGTTTTDDSNVIGTHTTPSGIKVELKKKPPKDTSSGGTSGTGGTTLGSSVHGTGSYNPGGSSSSNQVNTGSLGSSVHGTGSYGNVPSEERKTCFHPEQLVGNKFIKDLEPGDLINGIKILGMVKLKLDEDMYSLNDVRVTGTHKVKYNNTWMYVSNHPESFKINDKPEFVYVPIVEGGTFIINNNEFADYDDEHIETLNNKLKVA